jgi:hypothetical protein
MMYLISLLRKKPTYEEPSMPEVSSGSDKAHPQTALGTVTQPRRNLSLPVLFLRASLSGEATGGALCPALNSPFCERLRHDESMPVTQMSSRGIKLA